MSRSSRRLAFASALVTGFLGSAANAQVSGIEAYRTNPLPAVYAPLEANRAGTAYRANNLSRRNVMLARSALDRGEFRQAARLLDTRSGRSTDPEVRYLSAVAYGGLGQYARARALFADALAQAPGHVGARLGLALTDIRLGHRADAAAALAGLDQRREACGAACPDAASLDRATQVIRHFLAQAPEL